MHVGTVVRGVVDALKPLLPSGGTLREKFARLHQVSAGKPCHSTTIV